jgi:hypothetical protein
MSQLDGDPIYAVLMYSGTAPGTTTQARESALLKEGRTLRS